MKSYRRFKHIARVVALAACLTHAAFGADLAEPIREAGITGGIVVQIGSDDLSLRSLGDRFHVRLLMPDEAAATAAQAAIDQADLQGRFTVSVWNGGALPFADRVVNAMIVQSSTFKVQHEEIERVLTPRGLLFNQQSSIRNPQFIAPFPDGLDDWTHFLYDASGNAVSRDREVSYPRSFRWWAPPVHLRSHNFGASFAGLISGGGRVFYILDEGTYLAQLGGLTERWSLVARDGFNGALLWKRKLDGYGEPFFEEVMNNKIWRTPLSLNRRAVFSNGRLLACLSYRDAPLSILDPATGETIKEVSLGGSADEIVAEGSLAVCRVRNKIAKGDGSFDPDDKKNFLRNKLEKGKDRASSDDAKTEMGWLYYQAQTQQGGEKVVAVDTAAGKVLWEYFVDGIAHQTLAMADGKVAFHDYSALHVLDAATGKSVWKYDSPVRKTLRYGMRGILGNLLIKDGKILWTSNFTGGGVCLSLADGEVLWTDESLGATGGFGFPTAQRVVNDIIWRDGGARAISFKDGSSADVSLDIGDMLKRGHHVRCHSGRATERYIIYPMRGLEFVDLQGDNHMVCDWLRGACSYGIMPAYGLTYITPDPCSCYAGARTVGFFALAPKTPLDNNEPPPPTAPERLTQGPAAALLSGQTLEKEAPATASAWPVYMANARRTSFAGGPLSDTLKVAWIQPVGADLTQATLADGMIFVADKETCELVCLDSDNGNVLWRFSFPGAIDGPPTVLKGSSETWLFIGCRDGSIYSLQASTGKMAWRYRAAPLDRLTISNDHLENIWPVSSSVLYMNGLLYAAVGRNSYFDQGIHLVALDPATGTLKHHSVLEGPWPDKETIKAGVFNKGQVQKTKDKEKRKEFLQQVIDEFATGYHVPGGEADLLVTDGKDLFMAQNMFDTALTHIPRKRRWQSGHQPLGKPHMMANFGLLDNTLFHRTSRLFDDSWPGYGSGPGSAARSGSFVVAGEETAYAAQHWSGGGYASHAAGSGNLIVADHYETDNLPGDMFKMLDAKKAREIKATTGGKAFTRTDLPLWEAESPLVIRSMFGASDGNGNDLLFCAGVIEGENASDWDESLYYRGPGKLMIHNTKDGAKIAEYDLPACPVYDGMSAADGKIIIPMVNGEIACFSR